MMSKNYLSRAEVMSRFGLKSTATLYGWIKRGLLPQPIRFGRCACFRRESVDKAEALIVARAEENMRLASSKR